MSCKVLALALSALLAAALGAEAARLALRAGDRDPQIVMLPVGVENPFLPRINPCEQCAAKNRAEGRSPTAPGAAAPVAQAVVGSAQNELPASQFQETPPTPSTADVPPPDASAPQRSTTPPSGGSSGGGLSARIERAANSLSEGITNVSNRISSGIESVSNRIASFFGGSFLEVGEPDDTGPIYVLPLPPIVNPPPGSVPLPSPSVPQPTQV